MQSNLRHILFEVCSCSMTITPTKNWQNTKKKQSAIQSNEKWLIASRKLLKCNGLPMKCNCKKVGLCVHFMHTINQFIWPSFHYIISHNVFFFVQRKRYHKTIIQLTDVLFLYENRNSFFTSCINRASAKRLRSVWH